MPHSCILSESNNSRKFYPWECLFLFHAQILFSVEQKHPLKRRLLSRCSELVNFSHTLRSCGGGGLRKMKVKKKKKKKEKAPCLKKLATEFSYFFPKRTNCGFILPNISLSMQSNKSME
ncbi:hypothetical protein CEXT_682551 [Caerostris extrusa]|uniref:Uncharacterized protein n=1 Tax=Caerostris extrusa TaxID=172846 RepID=A0AAV4T0H2_CAEEX|nr:hypothetical protein CEXT_682551 [Caerostris extrusa]